MATSLTPTPPDGLHPFNISLDGLYNLSEVLSVIQAQIMLEASFEESYMKASMINVALSTLFFGLSTVLAAVTAYVLFLKGIRSKAAAIMFIAIIIMWMSTVADWVGTLVAAAAAYSVLQNLTSQSLARTTTMTQCLYPGLQGYGDSEGCREQLLSVNELLINFAPYHTHDCLGTAALTINVLIGDVIIWWRAWILWPNNRVVRLGCILMILLTTCTGIMNTRDACRTPMPHGPPIGTTPSGLPGNTGFITTTFNFIGTTDGILFSGDVWGIAAVLSSLLTNTVATALIAYRAWQHRCTILSYLRSSSQRTQMERTLALLVESGVFFCALWIVIAVYEFASWSPTLKGSAYQDGFYYVMEGCLVPLLGMYPTLVITLCAADKSLHRKSESFDDDRERNASIVFAREPPSRTRGTLSELLSATSATTSADAIA